jgi:hypothetical protein
MATAVCDGPALERIHAALPAALRAGHVCQPGALVVPEITSIVRRPLTGRRRARGEDPLRQEGSPVQVPATVRRPAGRFTGRVVRP